MAAWPKEQKTWEDLAGALVAAGCISGAFLGITLGGAFLNRGEIGPVVVPVMAIGAGSAPLVAYGVSRGWRRAVRACGLFWAAAWLSTLAGFAVNGFDAYYLPAALVAVAGFVPTAYAAVWLGRREPKQVVARTRPMPSPGTSPVTLLREIKSRIDALPRFAAAGLGDIHPGISGNLDEAVTALDRGVDPSGRPISPAQVSEGLVRMLAYVRSPDWAALARRVAPGPAVEVLTTYLFDIEVTAGWIVEGGQPSRPSS